MKRFIVVIFLVAAALSSAVKADADNENTDTVLNNLCTNPAYGMKAPVSILNGKVIRAPFQAGHDCSTAHSPSDYRDSMEH
jgi:opacity protein-like surface antigen